MQRSLPLVLALLALAAPLAQAYPIPPHTLRQLLEGSELVVVAKVVELREAAPYDEEGNRAHPAIAVLEVRETLQGKEQTRRVEVVYEPGMMCPAPARYAKGEVVLAFLSKYEGRYRTTALSYGSKSLEPAALASYRVRIGEYQKLSKSSDRVNQTRDWLVRCALDPATRWEGARDLLLKESNIGGPKPPELTQLTKAEQRRLRIAFQTAPALDDATMKLAELVASWAKQPVLDRLRDSLEATARDVAPTADWVVNSQLYMSAELLGWKAGEKLASDFDYEAADWQKQVTAFVAAWDAELARRAKRPGGAGPAPDRGPPPPR